MGRKSLELSGKVGINYTVIEKLPSKELGLVEWSCLCNCGNTFIATSKEVVRLKSLSCGCKSVRRGERPLLNAGDQFGRLTVTQDEFISEGRPYVLVSCACGISNKRIRVDSLTSSSTQSCGCLQKEMAIVAVTTHGLSATNTYKIYHGMIARCHDPKSDAYEKYGAAGVKVCQRWLDSFENFLEDMGERPGKEFSVDRIDAKGNYSPENCRWETQSMQAFNQKKSKVNTSGRTSVFWYESRQRWVVKIMKEGREHWFGQYKDFDEACIAAEKGEIELFGFSRSSYNEPTTI